MQLLQQPLVVVALRFALQGIESRVPLAHPEVGPALGQLGNSSTFDGPLEAEQASQLLFRGGTAMGLALLVAQLTGSPGARKAFAQGPTLSLGGKAELDLR